ncbi:haloacid dehalogenase [Schizophyllum commune H4-8]|uniref:haloacid dehalogenase n=1 Tax=Schizophyllum commune (strain H4-8 / FGSC 9210) TaxID=578458 RepID=UPI002160DD36|nr:haloacid dehalogenase [Schizophyllum commune H4-8]KAI5896943.1 haloacid dehalogenase [Schizophyllum commune H4-8]
MDDVEVLLFDVFGTIVDWYGTIKAELARTGEVYGPSGSENWHSFAMEWRWKYDEKTSNSSAGSTETRLLPVILNEMQRKHLDEILDTPQYAHIGKCWNKDVRDKLNGVWHRLDGWPDSSPGLYALKKDYIIATLSNGNVRLLVDMAKHADLPWDAVFSGDIFGSYKPSPRVYLGALKLFSVPPERCAMVAMHIEDLRGAAKNGLKTIYVRRPEANEPIAEPEVVTTKAEGGEVDVVVDSLVELAGMLRKIREGV